MDSGYNGNVINVYTISPNVALDLITQMHDKKLTRLNIPYGCNEIADNAFSGEQKLEYVEIPNSVKLIGRSAFEDCGSLRSIIVPNSVRAIDNFAFERCVALESIEIPSCLYIGIGAFYSCNTLGSIKVRCIDSSISKQEYEFIMTNIKRGFSLITPDDRNIVVEPHIPNRIQFLFVDMKGKPVKVNK